MEKDIPLKILIADDDPDDLEYLKFIFDKHTSFQIVACLKEGAAVVEHISDIENKPDVLLIDMYMPLLTGSEVVNKLAALGLDQDLKMFIISTTINKKEQENLQHNNNVKFLEKPTNLPQLNDLPSVILSHLNLPDANTI